jgi:hypothetical protein
VFRRAPALGFAPLPAASFGVLAVLLPTYLVCVEVAKARFFRTATPTTPRHLRRSDTHRTHRIAARWSHHNPLDAR